MSNDTGMSGTGLARIKIEGTGHPLDQCALIARAKHAAVTEVGALGELLRCLGCPEDEKINSIIELVDGIKK
jgi:hypothetical protein